MRRAAPGRVWLFALVLCIGAAARAGEPTSLVIPNADNLRDLPIFVALGAGLFAREGLDVTLELPPRPAEVATLLHADRAQAAVLPPPVYLRLIDERFPLTIVANLFQNDGVDLIVRGSIAAARRLPMGGELGARLRALAGLRIGVAPGPVGRLRALYRSQGLDADRLLKIVILMGPEQNGAFVAGKVDALFAHTPYLERALLDEGARLYVDLSSGRVPALAAPMIHALVVTRKMARSQPAVVRKLVRAIARAEALVHEDRAAALAAVERALPKRDPVHLARALELYTPAVPRTPEVSVEGARRALAFFPANKQAPTLAGVDLRDYVENRFAREALMH